jgi:hypothetical protein
MRSNKKQDWESNYTSKYGGPCSILAIQWTSTPDAGSVKTEQKRKEKLKIKIFTIIVHFIDKSITCNPF